MLQDLLKLLEVGAWNPTKTVSTFASSYSWFILLLDCWLGLWRVLGCVCVCLLGFLVFFCGEVKMLQNIYFSRLCKILLRAVILIINLDMLLQVCQ